MTPILRMFVATAANKALIYKLVVFIPGKSLMSVAWQEQNKTLPKRLNILLLAAKAFSLHGFFRARSYLCPPAV